MTITSAGDIGDVIVLLAVMAQIPDGRHTLLLQPSPLTKYKTNDAVAALRAGVKRLAESQPHIERCDTWNGEHVDWRSQDFRGRYHTIGNTLMGAHALWLQVATGITANDRSPWLTVDALPGMGDVVLINRSERHQNVYFQWAEVVRHYGHRARFIGTKAEHRIFCQAFGNVAYQPTTDMLDAAQMIAGCGLFIGNQSSCMNLAIGIGAPAIQEVCLHLPDCIYPRHNIQYCADGAMSLPDVGGSGKALVEASLPEYSFDRPRGETPSGGWRHPLLPRGRALSWASALRELKKFGMDEKEAEAEVLSATYEAVPAYFRNTARRSLLTLFVQAMKNAGLC